MHSPFFRVCSSHLHLTRSKELNGIDFTFDFMRMVDHSFSIPIWKWCMAQSVPLPFSCSTACSPQHRVPTHPMARTAFFECRSHGKRKVVTSSNVRLPSHVSRLEDLNARLWLPEGPGVSSEEPRITNTPTVSLEKPQIPDKPGACLVVFSARVVCTW